jgi:hypothetical protein
MNPEIGQTEKVDPSSIEIIENDTLPGLAVLDRDIVGESFVPESLEQLYEKKELN